MKFSLFLILYLISISLFSQNLIQNGDFELFRKQSGYFLLNDLDYWKKPTWASSDYQTSKYRYKDNNTPAFSGDANIGLIIYMENPHSDYSEYATNQLSKNLIKDSLYCFTLYVSLGEHCNFAPKNLDVYFSKHSFKKFTKKSLASKFSSDIHNIGDKYIMNKVFWEKRCSIYKAVGGEKYLTIGLFSVDKDYLIIQNNTNRYRESVYLYIDLVSLTPISDSSKCQCNKRNINFVDVPKLIESKTDSIPFTIGDIIKLSDVHFESNSYELTDSSKQELNKLFDLLSQYPNLRIKINGHTDNIGKAKTNLRLSERRAKAIVGYLIEKGIDKSRLTYEGFGEYMPLVPNTTTEGRAINRRVEFEIIK